ncbi:MAG TPA: MBL fold metallo-hydrolase [Thermoanaerobaculia bacterium]|nr:MBL fold metallo-hydrolase [Thermoanaerobaculia bacterium]
MRLYVLGSSGGYSAPDNPCSGFLLEHAAARLWIDAGNGTFAVLQRLADFTRIDAVVLSHLHPDHCADLYPLQVALRYRVDGALQLPLYGPPGTLEALGGLLGPDGAKGLAETFPFQAVDEGNPVTAGDFRLSFLRTDHPGHTLAIRVETSAGTLTYSADTGPNADLAGFAQGSDLLLCEATYQEGKAGAPVHLTARQAAETALRAGARELAVTHVWPTFDPQVTLAEARSAAPGLPMRWAHPDEVFPIAKDPV